MNESQTVFLRKVGGFYHAFDEDAILLFSLFHYKINNGKSGFPIGSIQKVIEKLKEQKVNYFVKVNEEEEESMSFYEENRYLEIYEKGKQEYREFHKKEKVTERIFRLDEKQVDQVIEFVQSFI